MEVETEKTSLKQLIQGMNTNDVSLLQGVVISKSPIRVQIIGDEKLILGVNSLYIPEHLTDREIEIEIEEWETENKSGGTGESAFASHSHNIEGKKKLTVKGALKTGDTVYILSLNRGRQYYILDRKGKNGE